MTDKNKGGRPATYSEELADLICERIATHDIGLKRICAMYDDMPPVRTIMLWRFNNSDFADKFTYLRNFFFNYQYRSVE